MQTKLIGLKQTVRAEVQTKRTHTHTPHCRPEAAGKPISGVEVCSIAARSRAGWIQFENKQEQKPLQCTTFSSVHVKSNKGANKPSPSARYASATGFKVARKATASQNSWKVTAKEISYVYYTAAFATNNALHDISKLKAINYFRATSPTHGRPDPFRDLLATTATCTIATWTKPSSCNIQRSKSNRLGTIIIEQQPRLAQKPGTKQHALRRWLSEKQQHANHRAGKQYTTCTRMKWGMRFMARAVHSVSVSLTTIEKGPRGSVHMQTKHG